VKENYICRPLSKVATPNASALVPKYFGMARERKEVFRLVGENKQMENIPP
jgi:hypothetical protein